MILEANKTYCGNPIEEHKNKGQERRSEMVAVNEIFGPTIQGEGKSAGKEVLFLRTAGCNLACIWCDTPYTWNWKGTKFQHPDKYDPKKEVHQMTPEEIKSKLNEIGNDIKALVISGGEPILQQKKLIPVIETIKQDGYWVEVETNGTIVPTDRFLELVDQINCSPKLSNSGPDNPLRKRENPEALIKFSQSNKTYFKFVVMNEQDLNEVLELVKKYEMKNVFLMPEGRTKDEQEQKMQDVEKICKENGFEFSPRLHVLKWGNKRAI